MSDNFRCDKPVIDFANKVTDLPPAVWMEYKQTREYKQLKTEIDAAYKQNDFNNLLKKILKNNAKIAKFEEIRTTLADIWNKYAGKQYGPKTKDKIYDEIKSACACSSYIDYSYYGMPKTKLSITPLNNAGYSHGCEYGFYIINRINNAYYEFLTDDNKILPVDADAFKMQYIASYIDDPAKRIEQLSEIKAQAIAKQKELEEITHKYNALTVAGIDYISATKHIY